MNLAILGTGPVGRTLGTAWIATGHHVALGSRTADNGAATTWAADAGPRGTNGTFASAVEGADVIVNATGGMVSLAALATCDPDDLAGKTLLDAANPLDFSDGFPPTLSVCNDDSLGEQIQLAHPRLRVVKALNTMSAEVMVDPGAVPGDHLAPICGNDEQAKAVVRSLLVDLGWPAERVRDLGTIQAARGMEMWLALWIRLYGSLGHPMFNLALPAAPDPASRT